MAPWLLAVSALAILARSRLCSALIISADPEDSPALALDAARDPTGETKRARTEWWTAHPPQGRRRGSELPQCGDRYTRSYGFVVPSYVGPAPANFTWDPEQLKEALRGRRVVLIGDSLTRQWSSALACYLTGAVPVNYWSKVGMEEVDDLLREIRELRDDPPYALPYEEARGTFEVARLHLPDVNAEIVTYMRHNFSPRIVEGMLALHARTKSRRADLLVINQGVHYNDPNGPVSLADDLAGYMELCRAEGLRCVLRESSAQHFWNAFRKVQSGLYDGNVPRACLGGAYNESQELLYDTAAEWRRDDLRAALQSAGRPESVMPIFEATMPLTFAHNGNDCTHYAGNAEYWEPWHAALFGLLLEQ